MEIHNITWRGVEIEITFAPEQFGMVDHIELRTEGRTLLPVTETGYRSNFIPAGTVEAHGGAIAFVTDWLDHEAVRKCRCISEKFAPARWRTRASLVKETAKLVRRGSFL